VFDYGAGGPSADQSVLVPSAAAGQWYVLVYNGHAGEGGSTFTLRAVASDIRLTRISPDRHGALDPTIVTLLGAGFIPGTTVVLVDSDDMNNTISPDAVEIDSSEQITAVFSLSGRSQVDYDIRVTRPNLGDDDTLARAFNIIAPGVARLETRLIMPESVGRHALATIYVEYANTGTAAMPAPLLRLQSTDDNDSDRPLLTLDQTRVTEGFWTSAVPDGFSHSIQILASGAVPGVLNPGESFSVPVYFAGLLQPWDFGDNTVEMEIRIFDSENTDLMAWEEIEEQRPFTISPEAWDVIFANLQNNVGQTWGDYVEMLADNGDAPEGGGGSDVAVEGTQRGLGVVAGDGEESGGGEVERSGVGEAADERGGRGEGECAAGERDARIEVGRGSDGLTMTWSAAPWRRSALQLRGLARSKSVASLSKKMSPGEPKAVEASGAPGGSSRLPVLSMATE
jgi:hypothetical protein